MSTSLTPLATALANGLSDPLAAPSEDPAELGWPPTLPIEVALRVAPNSKICEAYGISRTEWEDIRRQPGFVNAVAAARKELEKEGMSFKMKARLQAEELLKTSWRMIHAPDERVPPTVKADLLKFTVRAAGLDGSKDPAVAGGPQNALQINIHLG